MRRPAAVQKIVSGGQTGADRAALEVARELGLPTGGWVPRGRRAEDGPVPRRFPGLIETSSPDPAVRTERNVRDSDATLILSHGPLTGGSALTLAWARRLGRPALHLDLGDPSAADPVVRLREWLEAVGPRSLNVAGPRASRDPHIFDATRRILRAALAPGPEISCRGGDLPL